MGEIATTDPFRPLAPAEIALAALPIRGEREERLVMPVPADMRPTKATFARFAPRGTTFTEANVFRNERGDPMFYSVRYDGPEGKEIRPFCLVERDGCAEWIPKAPPAPRIIYNLDKLTDHPAAPVLVCEGELTANAAAKLFTDYVTTTTSGGAGAAGKSDLSVFAGRDVTIWRDNDEPGELYETEFCRRVLAAGAKTVRAVAIPDGFPISWDLADEPPAGVTLDDLRRMLEEAAPIGEVTAGAAEGGPIPLFPPMPKADPFPVEALGPLLARAVRAIAAKVQVPDAIAAQSVLSTTALATQAHADVLLPYGQARPLSCFFVTIAGSGERKSTADNEALWPLAKRERVLREQHIDEIKEWRLSYAAWAAEKRKIEANGKLDLAGRRSSLSALGDEPEKPLEPFITSGDITFEGFARVWPTAHASLGIFTAEGGTFTGGHGLSDEARLRTAAALSELWDGKPIKRIRAKDGVSILPGRRLSLHVMVQHEVAAQFLSDPLLRDQGLLSRILVVAPDSIAGSRFYREPTMEDEKAIRAYGARILTLLEQPEPLAVGSRNELQPRALIIGPAASELWRAFHDSIEAQVGPDGALRPIRDFAAKIAEHAARIAGVLTIVDNGAATTIEVDAMERAVALADFYVSEAVRLAQASRTDPRLIRAQALLDWIGDRRADTLAFRDMVQLGPSALRTKAAMEESVAILIAHGWLEEASPRPRRLRFMGGR